MDDDPRLRRDEGVPNPDIPPKHDIDDEPASIALEALARALPERINADPGPNELLLRVSAPVQGYIGFLAWGTGEGKSAAVMAARFFTDDAHAYVEQTRASWKNWLDGVAADAVDFARGTTA